MKLKQICFVYRTFLKARLRLNKTSPEAPEHLRRNDIQLCVCVCVCERERDKGIE